MLGRKPMKKGILKRFLEDQKGSAYILAAFSIVPIFGMMALAVDYTNKDRMVTELETASETVALHIAKRVALYPDVDRTDLIDEGKSLMSTLMKFPVTYDKFEIDPNSGKVQIVANSAVDTYFGGIFDVDTMQAQAKTQAQFGRQDIEVAIAIDNSGSMAWDAAGNSGVSYQNSRMASAKKAIELLVKSASLSIENVENASLRFSLIPWNTRTRLKDEDMGGSDHSASWIDWEGRSVGHYRHLAPYLNDGSAGDGDMYFAMGPEGLSNGERDEWVYYDPNKIADYLPKVAAGEGVDLTVLRALPNIGLVTIEDVYDTFTNSEADFRGCFDHRAGSYKYSFDAPTTAVGNSLYVPHFAPDEYDWLSGSDYFGTRTANYSGISDEYRNSYISDTGGDSDFSSSQDRDFLDMSSRDNAFSKYDIVRARTFNTAKYVVSDRSTFNKDHKWGERVGPSADCVVPATIGLTSDTTGMFDRSGGKTIDNTSDSELGELAKAVKSMKAEGGTDLSIGLSWAMNTLTPHAPFDDAGDFGSTTSKILVFMTDGDNSATPFEGDYALSATVHGYMFDNPSENSEWDDRPTPAQANTYLDAESMAMCDSIKEYGVKVYFIYFGTPSAGAEAVKNRCASTPDTAISADSEAKLLDAFEKIGDEIGKLRLTHYTD